MAVEAMKAGAIEFLEKPFRTQELCDHIQRAIKLDTANWQDRQQRRQAQQQLSILTPPREKSWNWSSPERPTA